MGFFFFFCFLWGEDLPVRDDDHDDVFEFLVRLYSSGYSSQVPTFSFWSVVLKYRLWFRLPTVWSVSQTCCLRLQQASLVSEPLVFKRLLWVFEIEKKKTLKKRMKICWKIDKIATEVPKECSQLTLAPPGGRGSDSCAVFIFLWRWVVNVDVNVKMKDPQHLIQE